MKGINVTIKTFSAIAMCLCVVSGVKASDMGVARDVTSAGDGINIEELRDLPPDLAEYTGTVPDHAYIGYPEQAPECQERISRYARYIATQTFQGKGVSFPLTGGFWERWRVRSAVRGLAAYMYLYFEAKDPTGEGDRNRLCTIFDNLKSLLVKMDIGDSGSVSSWTTYTFDRRMPLFIRDASKMPNLFPSIGKVKEGLEYLKQDYYASGSLENMWYSIPLPFEYWNGSNKFPLISSYTEDGLNARCLTKELPIPQISEGPQAGPARILSLFTTVFPHDVKAGTPLEGVRKEFCIKIGKKNDFSAGAPLQWKPHTDFWNSMYAVEKEGRSLIYRPNSYITYFYKQGSEIKASAQEFHCNNGDSDQPLNLHDAVSPNTGDLKSEIQNSESFIALYHTINVNYEIDDITVPYPRDMYGLFMAYSDPDFERFQQLKDASPKLWPIIENIKELQEVLGVADGQVLEPNPLAEAETSADQ